MEPSLILARCWGIILIIVCTVFLFNKKIYTDIIKAVQTEGIMYLYGLITLILGALSISLFNVWTLDYKGLLTIFGWVVLFKGISAFAFPEYSMKQLNSFKEKTGLLYIFFAVFLLLGIYLLYIGFVH